jgi:hypothetical protein
MPAKVAKRRTMRELSDERHKEQRADMEKAIAEGRLTVRQMTPKERAQSDAHRAAGSGAREARAARSKDRRAARA